MHNKIINTNLMRYYIECAEECIEKGNYLKALSYLFSYEKHNKNSTIYKNIAKVYFLLNQYELSNQYWFIFMSLANKKDYAEAYQGLAVNFFNLDDFISCSYYIKLKVDVDGKFDTENLDEEIAEYFYSETEQKDSYYLAYPIKKENYELVLRKAKSCFNASDYKGAIDIYKTIPLECFDKLSISDYAMCCFVVGDDENTKFLCKKSIELFGENVYAYCLLSNLYAEKDNESKAKYYYKKTLAVNSGSIDECYAIVSSAISFEDNLTVNECINKIIIERPYDFTARFHLAISYINLGDYANGEKHLKTALKINPYDYYANFCLKLVKRIINKDKTAQEFLPFSYNKKLNTKVTAKYDKALNGAFNDILKKGKTDYNKILEELSWAIETNKTEYVKKALYIISLCDEDRFKKLISTTLLRTDIKDEMKIIYLYTLVLYDDKKEYQVVMNNRLRTVKPEQILSADEPEDHLFTCAYALCFAKAVYIGIENLSEIGIVVDLYYSKFREVLLYNNVSLEELSAVIFKACSFEEFPEGINVSDFFGVEEKRLKYLMQAVLEYYYEEDN